MKLSKTTQNITLQTKYKLTERELEVLKYLVKGFTNKEIGDKLFLTSHTIKAHVSKLLEKFDVTSRVSLSVKVTKECFTYDDTLLENY